MEDITCQPSVSERRRTTARGRQIMGWADVKLSSAQPRVRRLFLTSMPTFLAWAYTLLPGLVKNYSLPAQVSGNNYGTSVYTVNLNGSFFFSLLFSVFECVTQFTDITCTKKQKQNNKKDITCTYKTRDT